MFVGSTDLQAEGCTVSTFRTVNRQGTVQIHTLVSFATGVDLVVRPDGTFTSKVPHWMMLALGDALCPTPPSTPS